METKSGPNGDRTHDLQIISLALYRLSYRTIRGDVYELVPQKLPIDFQLHN